MANPHDANTMELETNLDPFDDDDNVTVCTATTATKLDYIEQEMEEFMIRYEISYRNGHPTDDDIQLHSKILRVLTKAFDDTESCIYNNKNKHIKDFTSQKWLDKDYYDSHFHLFHDKAQRKTVMAHCIWSQKPISTLKSDPSVMSFLKKSNTFLRAHFWKEDELDIKEIGFLVSYIPSKHSKSFVKNDVRERTEYIDQEWARVPHFRLIHATPKVKLHATSKHLTTQAYSVQILLADAAAMNQLL